MLKIILLNLVKNLCKYINFLLGLVQSKKMHYLHKVKKEGNILDGERVCNNF